MINTKNLKQINFQTATNPNEYQIQLDNQVYLFKDNQSDDSLSPISRQPYLDRTSDNSTTVDSKIGFSSNDQETESTPFGIKQFWY